jgi:SAM-dependent methyltransferase
LLDFGCGASHLYEYLERHPIPGLSYAGLDLSPRFIALCRAKYPQNRYDCLDVLDPDAAWPHYDYIVLNGVLTEKRELTFADMLEYAKALLRAVFAHARVGIAFNVMSKQVSWERADLFHLPLDTLADFVTGQLSRHFIIRNDYGLYEYTTYVYREPAAWPA